MAQTLHCSPASRLTVLAHVVAIAWKLCLSISASSSATDCCGTGDCGTDCRPDPEEEPWTVEEGMLSMSGEQDGPAMFARSSGLYCMRGVPCPWI